jgi:hypothetical protein
MGELTNVKGNHTTMREHFAYLGITEVFEVEDSYKKMRQAFDQIQSKCIEAGAIGSKTKLLVYVFAASHGVMYNGATKT